MNVKQALGIAASGHVETSRVAAEILRAGGNAFDAAIAALCAACVAEPLLVSLGGGGFMLARDSTGKATVYDFFCSTPFRRRAESESDFFPITADFGADTQEFHVGMGAMAVPGLVAGMFAVNRDLGRMPMADLLQPAADLARTGVRIDALHHYIVRILEAILRADESLFRLFESPGRAGDLVHEGELLRNPDLAGSIEALGKMGAELFYEGDWARLLAADSRRKGGHLDARDLAAYRVERREPLRFGYRDAVCLTNPPPSPGGSLIAFTLGLLGDLLSPGSTWGDPDHLCTLAKAFRATSLARAECSTASTSAPAPETVPDAASLQRWRDEIQWHSLFSRGTTHISIADTNGNVASLTASNGEGNTYVLPGTGIILNNMLGEEDLHPGGFNRWREHTRLASMMSPMIVERADGGLMALGTGGSNRIRSAMVQVLVNLLQFDLSLDASVTAPRLHLEGEKLSLEAGYDETAVGELRRLVPEVHEWPAQNLFFGGVHSIRVGPRGELEGAGDPRRDGAVAIA